jgi:adenylosuccinate synthase
MAGLAIFRANKDNPLPTQGGTMHTKNVTVIGLQWGDEGKGKVVDRIAPQCRYVVRYCGGANAGHSVMVGDTKYALHLIPCGVLRESVLNIVGNGVVFDPTVAIEELNGLTERGITLTPDRLMISAAAHVVMPWHKLQDKLNEAQLGESKIGTTARGIGWCYADKAIRTTAIRVGELIDPDALTEKIRRIGDIKNKMFAALYDAEPMDVDAIVTDYVAMGTKLAPFVGNSGAALRNAMADDERILFEGGQGSMLDVDHGTYPFVTSSMVTACGVPGGTGVSPKSLGTIVGIVKAYSSRVGAGPFPSEQDNPIGERIRERGHEYGTTTGRPRRCGWLDAFAVRYAADLSGVDEISIMLLDVLSGFDELKICTGYMKDGQRVTDYDPTLLAEAEPAYETVPGWSEEITECRRFEDLPANAQAYVRRVEELLDRPVTIVSIGPERDQTIIRDTQIEGLA